MPDPLRPATLRSRCPVNAPKPPPWACLTFSDLQTQTSVQARRRQVMCSQGLPVCLSDTLTHMCTPSSQGPGVSCRQPSAGLLLRGFDCEDAGLGGSRCPRSQDPGLEAGLTVCGRWARQPWALRLYPPVCGVVTGSVVQPLPLSLDGLLVMRAEQGCP